MSCENIKMKSMLLQLCHLHKLMFTKNQYSFYKVNTTQTYNNQYKQTEYNSCKHSSRVQAITFQPRERMLAKLSTTWKLLLKLLGPEILLSSLKSIHSFLHSPSHLLLMHRHEHLLRKTTKKLHNSYNGRLPPPQYYFKYH